MLDLLVKSAVRRKVVAIFALNSDHELYSRQVALEIDESPHSVGLELHYLTKGGLLKSVARGRQVYYRFNNDYPFASIIKSAVKAMREKGNNEIRSLPDLARREQIEENLKQVLEDIKKYYEPEKIILFGSAASGKVGPYSDVDLVIVKKTCLPYFKRLHQLVDLLDYNVDIDFFVYTPDEFVRASKERRFFKKEILEKGKVLYEKAA